MDTIAYRLTATSRLSAATGPQKGNHTAVHLVLPGATVRGAFAAVWWRTFGGQSGADAAFADLFDTGLKVGQAVPERARLRGASTLVCRYRPDPGCPEFELDRAVAVAKQQRARPVCRACGGPLASGAGWDTDVTTTRLTSTQLTTAETAEHGRLFSRDALRVDDQPEGVLRFTGRLHVRDEGEVDWLDGAHVQIGAKRSLSFGLATVDLRQESLPAVGEPSPRSILRLVSPAIVVDDYGAPSLASDALLAEVCRVSGDEVTVVDDNGPAAWIRSELVSGWHMRSALPKPADWALAAGSCVVVAGLSVGGVAKLGEGIGYRTAEGYGQVEILDPDQVPDLPPGHGVTAVQLLRQALSPSHRAAGLAAARNGLARVRDAHATGKNPDPVITATLGSVPQLLGLERSALQRLLSLSPADLDDAAEAI